MNLFIPDKGVPHCVINRVVECLRGDIEQTIFQGKTSHPEPRLGGVRQGCPISPFAFDLIIEAVMISVEEELGIFVLNQKNRLSLPLVLVYADDVLILTEDVVSLEKIVACMESYLETVGFNLNRDKCQLLVRDPMGPSVKTVTLLGVDYDVQKSMKYLGISLTNRLNRPLTTRMRCRNTIRASKAVVDFVQQHQPTWELGRLIYETVLAPAMLYGTETSVLTRQSRTSLRNYERQIVREIAPHCVHAEGHSPEEPINDLLQNRTVTRKARARQMRWFGHAKRRPEDHPVKAATKFFAQKLRPCRPAFTWWDMVIANMKRYDNTTYRGWEMLAQDKDQFNSKTDEIYLIPESSEGSDIDIDNI